MKNIKEHLTDVEKDFQERKSLELEGIPFGIDGLDKFTLGMKNTELSWKESNKKSMICFKDHGFRV